MMSLATNLDLDEAPQNMGPHLRSKLFENQIIIILANFLGVESIKI